MKSRPLHLMAFRKREVRTQFGAVCWRMAKGGPEVLLVTSRRTGRWIIPKGWPQRGQTADRAAATEAWEEAGVKGSVAPDCLGIYGYEKRNRGRMSPCVVAVFSLEVEHEANKWPERKQRKRRWFSAAEAADKVAEPELARLLRDFAPSSSEVLRSSTV